MSGKGAAKKDDKKAPAKGGDKKEKKEPKKKKELTEAELEARKPSVRRANRKRRFEATLVKYLNEFKNILLVGVDNVGSHQMQEVRIALRGKAVLLMGKNTMSRKVIRDHLSENPKLEALLPHLRGNIGFVFTNNDLNEVRKTITEFKVPAPARSGVFAPNDIFVPPGPTGLDPGQTAFFQVLQIPTKINRGAIEITNEVHLVKKGEKVSASAVALLSKLNIKPFFYGITVETIYEDGSVYGAAVLDIKQEDLLTSFFTGVRFIAALGLQIGYPSAATLPHSFASGFKNLLAISLATEYTFKEAQSFKDYLANPEAFAASVGTASAGSASAEAVKEEEPEKQEEEVDVGMGGLFD